ncbi:MAG: flavin reductase family protein [Planctomycetes bacterium]|nr:flavin reductase family protein [Planctomycetota bacterium]
MDRKKIDYRKYYEAVMKTLTSRGLLLGSYDSAGKANAMTIGWGSAGSIWGLPVWIVLVRPSRYTYRCIEHAGCFSVNVPPDSLGMACALCGSKSGRDMDKLAAAGLTATRGSTVLAPAIEQCPIVYECQVVHSNDVIPARLAEEIVSGAYASNDYHRIYFGKILAAYASDGADKLLEA